jgi:predicted unusual protein kinase regulating ubiquinone biosynthesis (AarF/ABC1/UbiB family)
LSGQTRYNDFNLMLRTVTPSQWRWQQQTYTPLARQVDVSVSAAKFAFWLWQDGRRSPHAVAQRQQNAQRLVDTLLNLGPTFIKIGQALSTRADLLPLEYVRALSKLQDQVPQFSASEAIAIIETELGSPLKTLYRQFDPVPLAAASLGQVHRAQLHSGEQVVIKVQRPGLDQLFDLDFRVLGQLVQWAQRWFPTVKQYDLKSVHQEFGEILFREIDYIQEAMNADRFRHNFIDHDQIVVPRVYPRYTTKRVLTMEYVPGIKVNDRERLQAAGIDPKAINHLGICSYLKQLLQDGFFQADPHPGNMAVSADGKLIFYDFGMMAEVQSLNRDQMVQTFFAVLKKDTDQVVSTLTDMGLIESMSDMTPVRRIIRFLLERFTEKPVEIQAFKSLRNELFSLFERQPFRLPAKMTFIIKALTTLDGVARDLDPQYNLLVAAKPFVKTLATTQTKGSLGELARQTRGYLAHRLTQSSAMERVLQQVEDRLEQHEESLRAQAEQRDRSLKTIHLTVKTLLYACLTVGFSLTGAVLLVGTYQMAAIAAFTIAGVSSLFLLKVWVKLMVRERIDRLAGR